MKSVEQVVRETLDAVRKVREENNTPAKARAFLVRAGILEKHAKSPDGVRLHKSLR